MFTRVDSSINLVKTVWAATRNAKQFLTAQIIHRPPTIIETRGKESRIDFSSGFSSIFKISLVAGGLVRVSKHKFRLENEQPRPIIKM